MPTGSNIFAQRESIRPFLTPPCDGPFQVLKRMEKAVIIDLNARADTGVIHKIKPTYLTTSPSLCALNNFTNAETTDTLDPPASKAVSWAPLHIVIIARTIFLSRLFHMGRSGTWVSCLVLQGARLRGNGRLIKKALLRPLPSVGTVLRSFAS